MRQAICTPHTVNTAPRPWFADQPDLLVADAATHLDAALDREPWRSLRAVRLHRVYSVDPDSSNVPVHPTTKVCGGSSID